MSSDGPTSAPELLRQLLGAIVAKHAKVEAVLEAPTRARLILEMNGKRFWVGVHQLGERREGHGE